jgi:hypothetical protein
MVPKPGKTGGLEAVVQCTYCASDQGVLSALYTLEGRNSPQETNGLRHAGQSAGRSSRGIHVVLRRKILLHNSAEYCQPPWEFHCSSMVEVLQDVAVPAVVSIMATMEFYCKL